MNRDMKNLIIVLLNYKIRVLLEQLKGPYVPFETPRIQNEIANLAKAKVLILKG
jgi:hypothetical protein